MCKIEKGHRSRERHRNDTNWGDNNAITHAFSLCRNSQMFYVANNDVSIK